MNLNHSRTPYHQHRSSIWSSVCRSLGAVIAAAWMTACQAPQSPKIIDTVAGPDGGWDYSSFDPQARTLFVARTYGVLALKVDTMTVRPRLVVGQHVHSVVPLANGKLLVTNGETGVVTLADARTGTIDASISVGSDPDAAVLDPYTGHVFVMNGKSGDVSVIDPASDRELARTPVGGKLEFAAVDGRGKLFVNVEDKAKIVLLDTRAPRVLGEYQLNGCEEPTALAYIEPHNLLISACGNGHAKVISAADGKEMADFPIGPHPDAAIYDDRRHLVFIPCAGDLFTSGRITVVPIESSGAIGAVTSIPVQRGTRTGALDPATGRLYLPTGTYGMGLNLEPFVRPGSFKILVVQP